MPFNKSSQTFPGPAPVTYETVVPNPKLKLLDQMREVLRLQRLNIEHRTSNIQLRTSNWEEQRGDA